MRREVSGAAGVARVATLARAWNPAVWRRRQLLGNRTRTDRAGDGGAAWVLALGLGVAAASLWSSPKGLGGMDVGRADAQANLRLRCAPRDFRVVPGEPMRLRLTVQADSALSLRWEVPDEPRLKLRAIEKLPVRRTPEGTLVYEREIVWQALEPAAMKIKNLAVKIGDAQMRFPEVTITVRDPSP